MNVIILAAGKGERLLPLTRNTPKSLLEIKDGITVLELQLKNISKCGIKDVSIVTGYLTEQIEAKVQSYSANYKLDVNIIYNPFYDMSNNLISLWMANYKMGSDFLVINGDDIFHYNVLERLVKIENQEITMVVDIKESYEEDDMKAIIEEDRISQVSKKIPVEKANAESIGMIRFNQYGAKLIKETLDQIVRKKEGKEVFWLEAVQRVIDKGFPVNYLVVNENEWSEVDFHPDIKLAHGMLQTLIKETLVSEDSY